MPRDLLLADTADAEIWLYQYWIITFDGTRLRKVRRERGLSQERLSFRSRVSPGNRYPDVALTHARASICLTQPAAVLALGHCHSRLPLKEPDLGHQPANAKT